MIKVSVIIPVYNTEKYLSQCLDSVISQTLKDIEIICVDDGSTDSSSTILQQYEKNNEKIIVILQENKGTGAARNEAIKAARGEYISFLDSDDRYSDPEALEKIYLAAKENQARICGGNSRFCLNESESFVPDAFEKEGWICFSDYQLDYHFTRYIYQRELLVNNNIYFPERTQYEDPPFLIKVMLVAKKFYVITDEINDISIIRKETKKNRKRVLELISGMKECLEISSQNRFKDLHAITLSRMEKDYCDWFSYWISQNDPEIINGIIELNNRIDRPLLGLEPNYFFDPISIKNNEEKDYQIQNLHNDIRGIMMSPSYRIGRMFTWIPRKIRGWIRK